MASLAYAMVFVSDMKRSAAFYRDVMGLPLRFESPGWTEFSTGGTTLALHLSAVAAPGAAAGPLPPGVCRPGFHVEDLDAFHAAVTAKGVRCISPPKVEKFGVKIAGYADPGGLLISVAQTPKAEKWSGDGA